MSAPQVDEGTALLVTGLWSLLCGAIGYALALWRVRALERRVARRRGRG